jgi:23S rRNA pseudouridine1911/1915/1917 synthase
VLAAQGKPSIPQTAKLCELALCRGTTRPIFHNLTVAAQLSILYEDNHLLAINKPAGLATMGAIGARSTAAELAREYLKRKYCKPGNVYLGVVSRLDAVASGVLLLARTSKAAARLTDQFRRRTVEKLYLALVEGKLEPPAGGWQDYLIKDEAAQRMRVIPFARPGSKNAELHYRRLSANSHVSLLEITLLTGRKHQIRVQFASRGRAILGDTKYGSSESFPQGIALHAYRLTIEHPTKNTPVYFEAPLPEYWQRLVTSTTPP